MFVGSFDREVLPHVTPTNSINFGIGAGYYFKNVDYSKIIPGQNFVSIFKPQSDRAPDYSRTVKHTVFATIYPTVGSDYYLLLENLFSETGPDKSIAVPINQKVVTDFENLYNANLSLDVAKSAVMGLIDSLSDYPPRLRQIDKRIVEVLDYIKLNSYPQPSMGTLAELVHLSPSRLLHLFKQETHITLRKFIIWQKLHKASFFAGKLKSLTQGAHLGGFTDAAHFSNAFKTMFGVQPSILVKSTHGLHVQVEEYDANNLFARKYPME